VSGIQLAVAVTPLSQLFDQALTASRHRILANARAGLTILLWRPDTRGEADRHWASASGVDLRYRPLWSVCAV